MEIPTIPKSSKTDTVRKSRKHLIRLKMQFSSHSFSLFPFFSDKKWNRKIFRVEKVEKYTFEKKWTEIVMFDSSNSSSFSDIEIQTNKKSVYLFRLWILWAHECASRTYTNVHLSLCALFYSSELTITFDVLYVACVAFVYFYIPIFLRDFGLDWRENDSSFSDVFFYVRCLVTIIWN